MTDGRVIVDRVWFELSRSLLQFCFWKIHAFVRVFITFPQRPDPVYCKKFKFVHLQAVKEEQSFRYKETSLIPHSKTQQHECHESVSPTLMLIASKNIA